MSSILKSLKGTKITGTAVREYLMITLGLIIYTLGWTWFLIPQKIVGGGATGIGTLVYYLTGFPVGYTFLIFNVILIGIAMWLVGANFGVKTIYGVILAAVLLSIEQHFFNQPGGLLPDDRLLSAILGGVMGGLGIGITFSQGGSTGGTDIIAIIITKYRDVSPGRVILLVDLFIITSGLLVLQNLPFPVRIQSVVYGYLVMMLVAYMIDAYLAGLKQSMQVFIFTKHYESVSNRIVKDLHRGATLLNGVGWYTKAEVKIVIVVVRKQELNSLFKLVREEDPEAFASVGSVMGVYGKGFEVLKR